MSEKVHIGDCVVMKLSENDGNDTDFSFPDNDFKRYLIYNIYFILYIL